MCPLATAMKKGLRLQRVKDVECYGGEVCGACLRPHRDGSVSRPWAFAVLSSRKGYLPSLLALLGVPLSSRTGAIQDYTNTADRGPRWCGACMLANDVVVRCHPSDCQCGGVVYDHRVSVFLLRKNDRCHCHLLFWKGLTSSTRSVAMAECTNMIKLCRFERDRRY